MSYYVRHRYGGNDPDPPLDALADLLEDLDIEPRHLDGQSREEAQELMAMAATDRLDELFERPWLPGYGDDGF